MAIRSGSLLKKEKKPFVDTVSHTGANTQLKQIAACSKQSRVHDVLPLRRYRGPRDAWKESDRAPTNERQPLDENIVDGDDVASHGCSFLRSARSVLY